MLKKRDVQTTLTVSYLKCSSIYSVFLFKHETLLFLGVIVAVIHCSVHVTDCAIFYKLMLRVVLISRSPYTPL